MASPRTPVRSLTNGESGARSREGSPADAERSAPRAARSGTADDASSPSVRELIAARERDAATAAIGGGSPATGRAAPKKSQSFSSHGQHAPRVGARRLSAVSDGFTSLPPALDEEEPAAVDATRGGIGVGRSHSIASGQASPSFQWRKDLAAKAAAAAGDSATTAPSRPPAADVFDDHSVAEPAELLPPSPLRRQHQQQQPQQQQLLLQDDEQLARMASFRIRPRRVSIQPESPSAVQVSVPASPAAGDGGVGSDEGLREDLLQSVKVVADAEVPKKVTQMFFKELFGGGRKRAKDEDCIGFATLPDQVHRKAVKRGFHFTLMVVGESGLGKSTLINSLFATDLYSYRKPIGVEERVSKTIEISKNHMDIEEKNVRLRMTIIDTPGFGDSIRGQQSYKPIEEYIDEQFLQYLQDESGLNRRNITDGRVHCLLYFISPSSQGLKPLDVEVMRRLHHKVNIIPIIAKADTLTSQETQRLKHQIRNDLDKFGINIYDFPDCDSDEEDEFKISDAELKGAVPFAVIGSNVVLEVNGQRVRGRLYPWGIVEVENPQHSDFMKLRQMLMSTHLQDLKDVTEEVHYENFRAEYIQRMEANNNVVKANLLTSDRMNSLSALSEHMQHTELEKQLLEKEIELRRTQELLHKMQSQLMRTQQAV